MKPVSIVLNINAALLAVLLLLIWGIADVAKLAVVACGSLALFNLAVSGVLFFGKEKKFGWAFVMGFVLSAIVTAATLLILMEFFPAELDLLRSREI